MNGLTKQISIKQSRRKYSRLLGICLILYIFVLIIGAKYIFDFESNNNQRLLDKKDTILSNINEVLDSSINKDSELAKIADKYNVEIIASEASNLIYASLPIIDEEIVTKMINKEQIYYESNYKHDDYSVYFVMYKDTSSTQVNKLINIYTIVFVGLTIIFIMLALISTNYVIKPLRYLHQNLLKLKKHSFMKEDEKVNIYIEELEEFTNNIKDKITDFEIVYTKLEKELLIQNSVSKEKKGTISSLVHDLKVPVEIINLSVEKIENEIDNVATNLKNISDNSQGILVGVDDILTIINEDIRYPKEEFNVVQLAKTILSSYSLLFKEKGLNLDLEFDKEILMYASKMEIESIISNAISNISKYAIHNTTVEVKVFKENEKLNIITSNYADNETIDFDNVFNLFESIDTSKESNGVGMFIIDTFVKRNGGTLSFYPKEDKIYLEISFDLIGSDNNE